MISEKLKIILTYNMIAMIKIRKHKIFKCDIRRTRERIERLKEVIRYWSVR